MNTESPGGDGEARRVRARIEVRRTPIRSSTSSPRQIGLTLHGKKPKLPSQRHGFVIELGLIRAASSALDKDNVEELGALWTDLQAAFPELSKKAWLGLWELGCEADEAWNKNLFCPGLGRELVWLPTLKAAPCAFRRFQRLSP